MLLEISEEITPEIIKRQSQSKNNTQVWILLVMEAKSNAVNGMSGAFSSVHFSSGQSLGCV